MYHTNHAFIEAVDRAHSGWKAGHYPEYETMTLGELSRRAGASRAGFQKYE